MKYRYERLAKRLKPIKHHPSKHQSDPIVVTAEWEYFVEIVCYYGVVRGLNPRHWEAFKLRMQGWTFRKIAQTLSPQVYPETARQMCLKVRRAIQSQGNFKYWIIGMIHGQSKHWDEVRAWGIFDEAFNKWLDKNGSSL